MLEHFGDAGLARRTGGFHAPEIFGPQISLVITQVVQVFPGINPGVMAIGKEKVDTVQTHRFGGIDQHFALAGLQHFLPGTVTAHFGGRRIDAQKLKRQFETRTIGERDLQLA